MHVSHNGRGRRDTGCVCRQSTNWVWVPPLTYPTTQQTLPPPPPHKRAACEGHPPTWMMDVLSTKNTCSIATVGTSAMRMRRSALATAGSMPGVVCASRGHGGGCTGWVRGLWEGFGRARVAVRRVHKDAQSSTQQPPCKGGLHSAQERGALAYGCNRAELHPRAAP